MNLNQKRSLPRFNLTGSVELTFLRPDGKGRYVDGEYVKSSTLRQTILKANVQPLKYTDLMILPEADRTSEWIKIYHSFDEPFHLRTMQEGSHEADIVIWEDKYFKVMKAKHYRMGILDHVCVYAAREPLSAESQYREISYGC